MTYPPDAEALTLQQQAVRRVRKMQERAALALNGCPAEGAKSSPNGAQHREAPAEEAAAFAQAPVFGQERGRPAQKPPGREGRGADLKGAFDALFSKGGASSLSSLGEGLGGALESASEPVKKLLETFHLDGEDLVILLVMYLVFREKGDAPLLLALGYLLL